MLSAGCLNRLETLAVGGAESTSNARRFRSCKKMRVNSEVSLLRRSPMSSAFSTPAARMP